MSSKLFAAGVLNGKSTVPDSVLRRMGELGFLGLDKPEEYGGQGGDYYTALVLAEELTHARSGGLLMTVGIHADSVIPPLLQFGSEQQTQDVVSRRSRASSCFASVSPSRTPARTSPA